MRNIIYIKLIIISLMFLLLKSMLANDTILRQAIGTSTFYNIIHKSSGVYIGSNKGIYRIDATEMQKVSDKNGYIDINDNNFEVKTTIGIERNFRFNRLLPKHFESFPHQSVINGNYIYIICKGTLFIFEVVDITLRLPGISVRCFTENSIGTYSGIYCYGEKLTIPTYTTGDILEIDSTFYICYDGLAVKNQNGKIDIFTRETTGETELNNIAVGFAREIIKLYDSTFVLFTTKGIYFLTDSLGISRIIYKTSNNRAPILIDLFDNSHNRVLTFASDDSLFRFGLEKNELLNIGVFSNNIIDGFKQKINHNSEYILLSEDMLTLFNYSTGEQIQIPNLYQAHSVISFGLDSVLISSQDGIYFAILNTNKVFHLFKGTEFNRRALYIDGDSIKIGSVDGYILISKKQLIDKISEKQNLIEKQYEISSVTIFIITGIVGLIFLTIYLLLLWKKRLQDSGNYASNLTLSDIEDYIHKNLNQVTIKSINTKFNLNNRSLYNITSPYKPGNLITKIRTQKAKELFMNGLDFKTISDKTGFSKSYLRKIVSKKRSNT